MELAQLGPQVPVERLVRRAPVELLDHKEELDIQVQQGYQGARVYKEALAALALQGLLEQLVLLASLELQVAQVLRVLVVALVLQEHLEEQVSEEIQVALEQQEQRVFKETQAVLVQLGRQES